MKLTAILFGLIFVTSLGAQKRIQQPSGDPSQPAAPSLKPGRIEGVVTNAVNGEAVKKATVNLYGMGRSAYATSSDSSGHFTFDNVDPGKYFVVADRSGFMMPQPTGRNSSPPKQVNVNEDQTTKDVEVKLSPLATASGHVVDDDGDPVTGAQVRALRFEYNQGKKRLIAFGYTISNDIGGYQFIDLQPGRYYFMVSVPWRRMTLPQHTRKAAPEESFPPTFYPNAASAEQGSASELAAGGQLANIDFRLRKAPSFHIRGKVVDGQSGQAVRNVNVQVTVGDSPILGGQVYAAVQQDGSFDIGALVNGSYRFFAQHNDGVSMTYAAQEQKIADQDVDGLLLSLMPGIEISGTLQVDGTAPDKVSAQVSLAGSQFSTSVHVSDASFVLHKIFPDVYQVSVNAQMPGKYVKTIRFGDRDIVSGELDLSHQSSGELTVRFGDDGAQVTGTVQDRNGQPAQGAMVTVGPTGELEGRHDLIKYSSADASGNFTIKDLAPGNYKVFAWETLDMNLVQSPDFRKIFEGRAASVSLGSNAHESVQLKTITGEDVDAGKSRLP